MVGEQGIVLRFSVDGGTYAEIEQQIVAHLNRFYPGQAWEVDVDAQLVESATSPPWFAADVNARRVVAAKPEPVAVERSPGVVAQR